MMSVVKPFVRLDALTTLASTVGKIISIDDAGVATVDFPGNPHGPIPARSILTESEHPESLETPVPVLLVFENEDPVLPIIVGIVSQSLLRSKPECTEVEIDRPQNAVIDGKRLKLDAKEEIVLNCGKSSITLKQNGKVIIKGVQVVSKALQSNKVRGGSVNIN